jgi:hypothetical protein
MIAPILAQKAQNQPTLMHVSYFFQSVNLRVLIVILFRKISAKFRKQLSQNFREMEQIIYVQSF